VGCRLRVEFRPPEEVCGKVEAFRSVHFEAERIDERQGPYDPRPWQIEALASLLRIREAGYSRALVAVATGMGKTWLAAFDAKQVGEALQRRPRVLVIAHRAHILAQAEAAISLVLDHTFGEGKDVVVHRCQQRIGRRFGDRVDSETVAAIRARSAGRGAL
jgi:superfamily II DNA or RNA helicase